MTRWLTGVLLSVSTLAAACGPGRSTTLPGTFGTVPVLPATSDHRSCLDPRKPQVALSLGWLPDTAPVAYDIGTGTPRGTATSATAPPILVTTIPINGTSPPAPAFTPPTAPVPPSPAAAALAARFEAAAGHGFVPSNITELVSGACVIERDVRLRRGDNGYASLQVLQVQHPFSPHSFPLGPDYQRQPLAGGGELLVADFDHDASRVNAVAVRPDGLLVRVTVASPNSTDVTGWPTTFASPFPLVAHTPAALTMPEVVAVAESLLASVAG